MRDTYLTVRQTGFPAGGYNLPDTPSLFAVGLAMYRFVAFDDETTPRTERPVRFQRREVLGQPMGRMPVCSFCGQAVCRGCSFPLT